MSLQLNISKARLDAVRRLMLGDLYPRCSAGDKIPEEELLEQHQRIRGSLPDCSFSEMVRLCDLRMDNIPPAQSERRKLIPKCMQEDTPSKVKTLLLGNKYNDVNTILTECATDND